MADTRLVVIRTFPDRIEAQLAHSVLEAAGVESVVRSDDAGGLRPALAFSNGAQLLVRAVDAARADEILRTPARPQ